jgi:hypothetical protein
MIVLVDEDHLSDKATTLGPKPHAGPEKQDHLRRKPQLGPLGSLLREVPSLNNNS